jgi:DNA-binding transcriptional MerR regulator
MTSELALPAIPAKRYFTIGEVGQLCGVKPHVLRYWEQEFAQLRPMKRRGNRRYYQHHEVLMIRRIRELLYEQGFTISGARNKMLDSATQQVEVSTFEDLDVSLADIPEAIGSNQDAPNTSSSLREAGLSSPEAKHSRADFLPQAFLREELMRIRELLTDGDQSTG